MVAADAHDATDGSSSLSPVWNISHSEWKVGSLDPRGSTLVRVRFSSPFHVFLGWPYILSTKEAAGQQGGSMLDPGWHCGAQPVFSDRQPKLTSVRAFRVLLCWISKLRITLEQRSWSWS